MEKSIRRWELHDRISSHSIVLANLFYDGKCLRQLSNHEIFGRDDYKYIGFGEDNIIVEDADGKHTITGVFLWGDCSIEFRIAPLDNLEDGDFACWSDYDEKVLKKVADKLTKML
jgi:hypothetical protein